MSNCSNQKNTDGNKKCANNEEIAKLPTAICIDETLKKSHDFIRTHFHRATNCDFCSKKVLFNYLRSDNTFLT